MRDKRNRLFNVIVKSTEVLFAKIIAIDAKDAAKLIEKHRKYYTDNKNSEFVYVEEIQ